MQTRDKILDWQALEGLRSLFLEDKQKKLAKDYWNSSEILGLYDETFAQRISWKWDAVLTSPKVQKEMLSFLQNPVSILDWGCGTGIASRTFLEQFTDELQPSSRVFLFEKSYRALQFAQTKIPGSKPWNGEAPDILLLSHVINELPESEIAKICLLIEKASYTFWVEPGTHSISRKLSQLRDQFVVSGKKILAPCPHQLSCPLLAPERSEDWCHHFAPPPSEVFQSRFWREFSNRLKVDLRSLPMSFLVIGGEAFPSEDLVIGRGKEFKPFTRVLVCSKEGKAETREISKRKKRGGVEEEPEMNF